MSDEKEGESRTWTAEEIVRAVFSYRGGCNPGRVAWLKTLGINANEYGDLLPPLPPSKTRVKITYEFDLDWDTWIQANYGRNVVGITAEQKRRAWQTLVQNAGSYGGQHGVGIVTKSVEMTEDGKTRKVRV